MWGQVVNRQGVTLTATCLLTGLKLDPTRRMYSLGATYQVPCLSPNVPNSPTATQYAFPGCYFMPQFCEGRIYSLAKFGICLRNLLSSIISVGKSFGTPRLRRPQYMFTRRGSRDRSHALPPSRFNHFRARAGPKAITRGGKMPPNPVLSNAAGEAKCCEILEYPSG